jgi:hypothetical protein
VRAMAQPHRTSFSSTSMATSFIKRPALAPMYAALGLTSLDQVISNRKLCWAGHVRRMDWIRLPRKFLASWMDAPRGRGQTHSYGHDLSRELQLIGFNMDRAAVEPCVSHSWGAAAQYRGAWRMLVTPVETEPISEQAQMELTQTEHWARPRNLAMHSTQQGSGPEATTWSQRLLHRRWEGHHTIPYHTPALRDAELHGRRPP